MGNLNSETCMCGHWLKCLKIWEGKKEPISVFCPVQTFLHFFPKQVKGFA